MSQVLEVTENVDHLAVAVTVTVREGVVQQRRLGGPEKLHSNSVVLY
jgi:hypothetical protein